MIPGFSTKKIKVQETLGQRFKNARGAKKISLVEAEAGTKVRAKFLAALEEGKWSILPQAVYVRGFVLAYARFLELNIEEIEKAFEEEVVIHTRRENRSLAYTRKVKETKVLITPRFLAYTTVSAFVLVMISYIVYQVSGFAGSPNLKIVTPENNAVVENDTLDLSGITDTNTIVKVNEENVPITDDGRFTQPLKLHRGVNVISVKAVNKAKKESSEVYTVEYRPKTAAASEPASDSNF